MVGWYLPVLVVDEEQMKEKGGVRVHGGVGGGLAIGKTAGGVNRQWGSGAGRNGTDTR